MIRTQITELLNADSPIVLCIDSGDAELQKMPNEKWKKLSRSRKKQIKSLVKKRNQKTLDKVDDADLEKLLEDVIFLQLLKQ